MAAVLQSRQVKNNNAPLTADGAEPVILTGTLTLTAALVVNDLLEMVILPAGYVPVDVVVCRARDQFGGVGGGVDLPGVYERQGDP